MTGRDGLAGALGEPSFQGSSRYRLMEGKRSRGAPHFTDFRVELPSVGVVCRRSLVIESSIWRFLLTLPVLGGSQPLNTARTSCDAASRLSHSVILASDKPACHDAKSDRSSLPPCDNADRMEYNFRRSARASAS